MVYGIYDIFKYRKQKVDINSKIAICVYCNYIGRQADYKLEKEFQILTNLCIKLIKKGWYVDFIPMELKGSTSEWIFIKKIINNIGQSPRIILFNQKYDIMNIISSFAENKIIISYKTHGVLYSLLQDIPIITIAYHQKTLDFMEYYNLTRFSIMDVKADPDIIFNMITDIEQNYSELRRQIKSITEVKFNEISKIFDDYIS